GLHLLVQSSADDLMGIKQNHPVIGAGQRIYGPLTFLGPSSPIVELHNLGAPSASDFDCLIGTLRVNNVDLGKVAQGFETAGQVQSLVANGNNDAYGDERQGCGTLGFAELLKFLHR